MTCPGGEDQYWGQISPIIWLINKSHRQCFVTIMHWMPASFSTQLRWNRKYVLYIYIISSRSYTGNVMLDSLIINVIWWGWQFPSPLYPLLQVPCVGPARRWEYAALCPRPSINYHHHLFYIREPFVTKKGILTVCLMGETFKLEQPHIYHTTRRTVWQDNPISPIFYIFWLESSWRNCALHIFYR